MAVDEHAKRSRLADIADRVMHEYPGASLDAVLHSMTYGQVRVLSKSMVNRQAEDRQWLASVTRVAQHATANQFRRFLNQLGRQDDVDEPMSAAQLARDFDADIDQD